MAAILYYCTLRVKALAHYFYLRYAYYNFIETLAYGHGNVAKLRFLFAHPRVTLSAKEKDTWLWLATVRHGNVTAVKRFAQQHNVDPSVRKNMAICIAAERGFTPIVAWLLQDARVDPSVDNQKPLQVACSLGRINTVKCLLACFVSSGLRRIALKLWQNVKHITSDCHKI